ncbi:hypothetical protein E3E26_08255 [Thermococcus sp. LS1]|uniref:hypothetical protein n=1 Tax=Thermococcus sp. LS1 TaxID=1638259 RepID=UPI00143974A0|nr:hypothetical protein [Thermococcus sp. LS1]NJD99771.1 hypothetical protein [Thermococcus sp. LS1]
MGENWDGMEVAGAVITGLGFLLLFAGSWIVGSVVIALGLVVWKMGEMRREFNEKLESLRSELDALKRSGGVIDG